VSAGPFAALAGLAREELALVTDGRYDELAALHARREAILAQLPASAPADALEHVREAARLQGLVTVALREARDATGAELARLRHTRRGVQGYAAGATTPAMARQSFSAGA
jgi:hypothetical protein